MNDLQTAHEQPTNALTSFSPAKTFVKRAGLEAAAKLAAKLGDVTRLRKAVAEKLETEAEFAAHVQAKFPKGAPQGHKRNIEARDARSGASSSPDDYAVEFTLADYCREYGFAARMVRRWYPLLDDAVREAETQMKGGGRHERRAAN